MSEPIQIIVIDDHPLMRFSIRKIMEGSIGIQVLAEGEHGSQLMALLEKYPAVDIVLLDLHMSAPPSFYAEAEIQAALQKYPHLKIIAFSGDDTIAMIQQIIVAGASGYLLKDSDDAINEIPDAIRTVFNGSRFYSERVLRLLMNAVPTIVFSPREQELIRHLVNGASNQQIAAEMSIAIKTVEHNLRVIANKLALPSGAARKEINIRALMVRKLLDMGYQ